MQKKKVELNSNSRQNVKRRETLANRLRTWLMHKTAPKAGKCNYGWMLLLPVMLLSGCGYRQPLLCPPPEKVPMPAMSESMPSESYSLQWKKLVETWQKKLDAMQATQKH